MEELSKEVLLKIQELKEIIKNSDEYKKYIEINKKLSKNQEIKLKIEYIKKIQQELVKCEYYKDYEKAKILENSLNKKKKELEGYPIYSEYQYIITQLNESLKQIRNLEDYLQSITK